MAAGYVTLSKAQQDQKKKKKERMKNHSHWKVSGVKLLLSFQMSCLPGHCRTSEEMKYTMTRLAMDGVDLFIVEHGCAANIKVISDDKLLTHFLKIYIRLHFF